MTCLSEDTLAEYLEGRLAPEARRGAEAHVDRCDDCYELFVELAHQRSRSGERHSARSPEIPPGAVAGVEPAPPPGAGDRVSRYEIRKQVGAGGMGVVYEAFDPLLGRRVALKLLHGCNGPRDEEMRARLLGEAKALARIVHPNVIAVHDVGLADGRVFLAMDFIEGQTLAEWLAGGSLAAAEARPTPSPRGWREILDVYLRAGRGLAAAHDSGLVHRDFKPANVMIAGDGRVFVTDFGLARASGAVVDDTVIGPEESGRRAETVDVHTRRGALVGSPGYMAPEQMSGEPVDVRADVFSFCVAFYQGLYGYRPFAGRTLRELRTNILAERVRAPPHRTEVPLWLYVQVVRGLRARPEERPATLAALLRGIELERTVRGLRRSRRILDEAEALSRLSGARPLTHIAHTLLHELAGDHADLPPVFARRGDAETFVGDMEVRGADAAALVADVKDYAALASHFIEREGMGQLREDGTLQLDPDAWYPMLPLLRALHALVATAGPRIAFELGLATARRTRVPPALRDLRSALQRPDLLHASMLRNRPGPCRWITSPMPAMVNAREEGQRALVVDVGGPWPPDFEHGIVTGHAQHFEPDAVVTHEPRPCRSHGDQVCRYVVRWGAQDCHAAIRLEPAATIEDFLDDPYGRYIAGERVFYWCRDPQLLGSVWWGTPTERDLERVGRAFDVLTRAGAAPHAALLDMRRVEGVDEQVYRRLVAAMRVRRQALGKAIRSLAVVRPRSMAGALISGFFDVEQQPYPVKTFANVVDALSWMGRPDACLVAELHALRAELSARAKAQSVEDGAGERRQGRASHRCPA